MIEYFVLVAILIILMLFAKSISIYQLIFKISAIILILSFSMFRYRVGEDWDAYSQIYNVFPQISDLILFSQGVLYYMACKIGNNFHLPFYSLTMLYSFLTVIFINLSIRKYKYWWFALILYIVIPGFFINHLSIIRQGLAISIIFYLTTLYLNNYKSKLRYFFISILAIFAHYTAIIPAIVLYSIFKFNLFKPKKEFTLYLLIILSILFGFLIYKYPYLIHFMLPSKYAHYIGINAPHFGSWYSNIKIFILCIYIFLIIRLKFYKQDVFPEKLFYIVYYGFIIFFITSFFPAVSRLSYYFTISQLLLIPYIIYFFKYNQRYVIIILLFLYFLLQFFVSLENDYTQINVTDHSKFTPYRTIFYE